MIDYRAMPVRVVIPGNCLMCTGVALEPIKELLLCEDHEYELCEHIGLLNLPITVFPEDGEMQENVEARLM